MPPFLLFAMGLVVGAGAALAAPAVSPEFAKSVRPLTKAALRAALVALHGARVAAAELVEDAEDLYAEVVSESKDHIQPAKRARPKARAKTKPRARRRDVAET